MRTRKTAKKDRPSDAGDHIVGRIAALSRLFEDVRNKTEYPEAAVLQFLREASFIGTARSYWEFMYDVVVEFLPMCDWSQGRIQWGDAPWDADTFRNKDEFCKRFIEDVIGKGFDLVDFLKQYKDNKDGGVKALEEVATLNNRGAPLKNKNAAKPELTQQIHELRSQGLTQQAIAEEAGVTQGAVAQHLDKIIRNKDYNVIIDSNNPSPRYQGNSQEYTIARLRRDGHEDLAEKVESKQMSARSARLQVGYEVQSINCQWKADADAKSIAIAVSKKVPCEMIGQVIAELKKLAKQE